MSLNLSMKMITISEQYEYGMNMNSYNIGKKIKKEEQRMKHLNIDRKLITIIGLLLVELLIFLIIYTSLLLIMCSHLFIRVFHSVNLPNIK